MLYEKNLTPNLSLKQREHSSHNTSEKHSDAPKLVVASKERSIVEEQLPAWGKALGFSDCFVKAQRESTLQAWARNDAESKVPEGLLAAGTIGGFMGTVVGLLALIPSSGLPASWILSGSLLVGAFSAVEGFVDGGFKKVLGKVLRPIERLWRRGSSGLAEISKEELSPLLQQFDQAPPEEKAFLGALLERWYARLARSSGGAEQDSSEPRVELLASAGLALKQRIAEAQALPQEMRSSARSAFALYEAIFELNGAHGGIEDRQLPAIRDALEELEPKERQAIFPMLSTMLFDQEKAKISMGAEVLSYLADVLACNDKSRAASIEVHHLMFDAKEKIRALKQEDLGKLRGLLAKMSPDQASACRALLHQSYFEGGRSKVKMDTMTAVDLLEIATAEQV